MRRSRKHLTAEERAELVRLYRDDVPLREICERLTVSEKTIDSVLHRAGVARRRPGGRNQIADVVRSAVVRMYREGATGAKIAATFGCHISTVQKLAREAGLRRYGERGSGRTNGAAQRAACEERAARPVSQAERVLNNEAPPQPAAVPTTFRAGTAGKLAAMAARLARGEALYHEHDEAADLE